MTVAAVASEHVERVGNFLGLRVGFRFLKGVEPKNGESMLRHKSPKGSKWVKFYFPKTGVDLVEDGVVYKRPLSMKDALCGELLLKTVGNYEETHIKPRVVFARFGAKEPPFFEFNEGSSYLPLWINRPEEGEFNTLYIRHNLKGEDPEYFALMLSWVGDTITLNIDPVGAEEVPPGLAEWR